MRLISKSDDRVLETLKVIPATLEHKNYILSTWIRSYEATARKLRFNGLSISPESYRKGEGSFAEKVWDRSVVVVSADNEYTIHAWLSGGIGSLYHVYVPPGLRSVGIARGLVEKYVGKEYEVHKPWPNGPPKGHTVKFNPWLIEV